ncbi:DNA excision repair protein ERCC-6-like 2 [Penicillium diatomitis]|uniref:DNA excision repair protein ERCC-6-like 2 n=1 Tax=Penicillium diatomitis TaxID=2819901 RepID=A0A9W9XHD1_9EURO|nr:DNA excision repair protein ERCC-6-like 2 [Penicillium diatomitis]KAJ5492645.1 DNA excision repair protein ERCC-6-like 2 [Penicillium diatomitis]
MGNLDAGVEVIDLESDDDDLEITAYARPGNTPGTGLVDPKHVRDNAAYQLKDRRQIISEREKPAISTPQRYTTPTKFKSEPRHPPSRLIPSTPIKAKEESEDEFNDGETTYKNFKERKAVKRKQAAAATRRAKLPKRQPRDQEMVGLVKPERAPARPKRPLRDYGEISSEDELMEYTLPDYLKKRRVKFDRQQQSLNDAGLKLPPSYDDVDFSDDERLEHLQERPAFPGQSPARAYKDITLPCSLGLIPAPIAQWLRPYQIEGVAFMHELFVYQKGGILGDDMGLGKTIQVIAFLTAVYGKTGDERDSKRMRKMRRTGEGTWYPRTIIICPGTLISNWMSELQRWGWWHVDVYHGSSKDIALHAAKSGRVEILITTYTTYVNNRDSVNMIEWDCVIADECHKIKERKSETTQAMNEINSLCRVGLTGTAIQNRYEELWTLLNWTNPGVVGPVTTWKAQIAEPLKIGQSHEATLNQLSKARRTAKKLVENLLPQFFLRRMKTLIADQLPKKSDRVVFCPLTATQAEAYENFLDSDIVTTIKWATELCDCSSGRKQGWCCRKYVPGTDKTWQSLVFPAIAVLQKLSNHLAILIPQGNDSNEKQEKEKEMLQIALPDQWEDLYRSRDSIVNYANPEFCGKWKVLRKLLRWWHANGDKVLVFSHSVRLLKMLQMLFNHTSYNVSYLDGSMKYEDRAKAVGEFNSDPNQFVFLISTKAGGVGLNITSANKVVVVDPNWNPAYDLQAQDRAYRIGQVRDVEVFRLVSVGTIEEIVYARQIYKQQQAEIGYTASSERRYFKGVQEKKDQKGEIFGMHNLFAYQHDNVVLRDIVNKTNVAESRAGVQVMDIEVKEDPESGMLGDGQVKAEDEAMSQLAAMIRGESDADGPKPETSRSHDPIQAILAGAGVEYTHLNNEVIGSSRVEERLSRRAEQITDDPEANFQIFEPSQLDDGGSDPFEEPRHLPPPPSVFQGPEGQIVRFKYNPPEDVKRRQFCSMARRFGYADATEFALVVENMTQAQRRECLDKWYEERRNVVLAKDHKEAVAVKEES